MKYINPKEKLRNMQRKIYLYLYNDIEIEKDINILNNQDKMKINAMKKQLQKNTYLKIDTLNICNDKISIWCILHRISLLLNSCFIYNMYQSMYFMLKDLTKYINVVKLNRIFLSKKNHLYKFLKKYDIYSVKLSESKSFIDMRWQTMSVVLIFLLNHRIIILEIFTIVIKNEKQFSSNIVQQSRKYSGIYGKWLVWFRISIIADIVNPIYAISQLIQKTDYCNIIELLYQIRRHILTLGIPGMMQTKFRDNYCSETVKNYEKCNKILDKKYEKESSIINSNLKEILIQSFNEYFSKAELMRHNKCVFLFLLYIFIIFNLKI